MLNNWQIVEENSKYKSQADKAKSFLINIYQNIDKSQLTRFLEEKLNLTEEERTKNSITKVTNFSFEGLNLDFILKSLKAQKKYFSLKGEKYNKLMNALEVCIKLYEEIDNDLEPKSEMFRIRKTFAKPDKISNVNGKAEEMRRNFYEYAIDFLNKDYWINNLSKLGIPDPKYNNYNLAIDDLIHSIRFSIFNSNVTEENNYSMRVPYLVKDLKSFDQIDFDKVKSLLNEFLLLIKKYKINTQKSEVGFLPKEYIHLSYCEYFLEAIPTVIERMKLPANERGYPKDYVEIDNEYADLNVDGKTGSGILKVEYPESLLYPGLIDNYRKRMHIIKIALTNKIDMDAVARVINRDKPSDVKESNRCMKHYKKALEVFNKPTNRYRYGRKSKQSHDNSTQSMLADPLLLKAYNDTKNKNAAIL